MVPKTQNCKLSKYIVTFIVSVLGNLIIIAKIINFTINNEKKRFKLASKKKTFSG